MRTNIQYTLNFDCREGMLHSFEQSDSEHSDDDDADTDNNFLYIGFLDVINECSSRLIPQDKKAV